MAYPLLTSDAMTIKKHVSRVLNAFVQKASGYLDDFNKAAFDDPPEAILPRSDSDGTGPEYADMGYELKAEPTADVAIKA